MSVLEIYVIFLLLQHLVAILFEVLYRLRMESFKVEMRLKDFRVLLSACQVASKL